MKKLSTLAAGLIAVGLVACGGDDPNDPNNPDPNDPNNRMVTLPRTSIGSIDNPVERDSDFACLNMVTAPTRTASVVDFDLKILDFQEDDPTPGVEVWMYRDNVVDASACDDPNCVKGTTGMDGKVAVSGNPGAWFAYRVFGKEGPTKGLTVKGSAQYNEKAPAAGGTADGISVSLKTLDLIPAVLGFDREPGTAIVAGRLFDCNDDDIYGAIAKIYDSSGALIVEGTTQAEPHYRYFDGDSYPSARQAHTHVDGLFAIANVPVIGSATTVTVEIYGRRTMDAEPVLLGRERARVFADTVTLINVGPLRSDGPTL